MKGEIKIKNKRFKVMVPAEIIQSTISALAEKMNVELKGKKPLFIAVLNGSFLFAADLLKKITIECEISFLKVSSYNGTTSTGKVHELIGLNEDIKNRTVVILEDIVDTGLTLEKIHSMLLSKNPKEIKVATLLFKSRAYTKKTKLDYVGMEVPDSFLVGYGLDYDGSGRNLQNIYTLIK